MAYAYVGSWQATTKLAGQSSAREVRDVLPLGKIIVPGPYPFCNMIAKKGMGQDGKLVKVMPSIKHSFTHSDKPELYDYEVQQDQFYLQEAEAGCSVGSSVTWDLDSVKGLVANEVLHKVDQGIHMRITSITSLAVTGTIIVNTSGEETASADTQVARIEKLSPANVDGATVGDGASREPTNRQNYLQFAISSLSVGILRDKVKHYADGESEGSYFREEKERMLLDLYRMKEGTYIAGQRYEEGSGSTRRYYTGGLEWWAGNTAYNNAADGLCSEDAFMDFLEDAMEAGGGTTLHFLCDAAFKRMVTKYATVKKRVTDNSKKLVTDIDEWETPVGTVVLHGSQFMNKPSRRGSAISFFPDNLEDKSLRGLGLTWMGDLNIPNVLVTKGAYLETFGLMHRNPASTTLWGNFQG
ncbi:MAG: hypothetical protein A3E01_00335 [Gammaproteobacteria bacterium RIFCSPHIGHO2_12_FULL_63_22]|nr:MAG: hypothetical protein A3E01_00335 [Gammaproteobacteria bacterium RIFCSPHIGHO2_12_FULL_63_22]